MMPIDHCCCVGKSGTLQNVELDKLVPTGCVSSRLNSIFAMSSGSSLTASMVSVSRGSPECDGPPTRMRSHARLNATLFHGFMHQTTHPTVVALPIKDTGNINFCNYS